MTPEQLKPIKTIPLKKFIFLFFLFKKLKPIFCFRYIYNSMTIELTGMTEIKISTSEKSLFKAELRQLIKQVFELQEQRVHVWNEFDLKFKEYTLDAPNFRLKRLQLICKEISDQLNSISMQIIDIREKFSSEVFNVKKLYNLVADLQASEQIKFQLVT